jgi:hypothetical protein
LPVPILTNKTNDGFSKSAFKKKKEKIIALGIRNPNWNLNQNQHTLFKTRLELVMNI